MISKEELTKLYSDKRLSANQIAALCGKSTGQVNYWLNKYAVKKRSISDAVYSRHNPNGDPFRVNEIKNIKEAILFGLGIGLYWGEGTKASRDSVRLGNSDPSLLATFIRFLNVLYGVEKHKLRFGLQLFQDHNVDEIISFWCKRLSVKREQFYKPIITISNKKGTYKRKVEHGVLTIYLNNKKLRDLLVAELNMVEKR